MTKPTLKRPKRRKFGRASIFAIGELGGGMRSEERSCRVLCPHGASCIIRMAHLCEVALQIMRNRDCLH